MSLIGHHLNIKRRTLLINGILKVLLAGRGTGGGKGGVGCGNGGHMAR